MELNKPAGVVLPLQKLRSVLFEESGVELFIYRMDLNHPEISGNKLYKLKYNLASAKTQNKRTILTFGGAFSNHIAATAAAGRESGFRTIGIIRGEENSASNHTLTFAKECGMELHFVSRSLYQDKQTLKEFISATFPVDEYYLIPEGGSNEEGIRGCREITADIPLDFDVVCCPCGTGTTLSGIVLSLNEGQSAIGFQVLKGECYIRNEVENLVQQFGHDKKNWSVNEEFHFGGYAKLKPELISFVSEFEKANKIPLDLIYTGKMMYGIIEMIRRGDFKKGTKIVALHTGGLQGNRGFGN